MTKHTNLSKEEKRRLSGTIRKDGKESTPGRKRYGPDYEKLKNASDQKSGVCHLCGEVCKFWIVFSKGTKTLGRRKYPILISF